MKAVYLAVQAISFIVIAIGIAFKFIFWGIPFGLYQIMARMEYWEQRILIAIVMSIYSAIMVLIPFVFFHLILSPVIGDLETREALVIMLGMVGLFGTLMPPISALEKSFNECKWNDEGVPLGAVKWFSLKEEKKRQKQEIENRKLAEETARQKDPDYVEAMREIGGLPKPKATFDDSYEYRRKEASTKVREALKQITR